MLTRVVIGWIVFAALMGFFVGGTYVWSLTVPATCQSQHSAANANSNKECEHQGEGRTNLSKWWDWTTHDAAAFYTFVLAALTVLLVGVTGVLGVGTFIAAYAARDAAKHIPTVERAYLFMRVVEHNTHIVLSKYEFFDEEHSGEPSDYRPVVDFVFDNVGKTPAIIREVSASVEYWTSLPTKPTYSPKMELLPRISHVKAGLESEKKMAFLMRDLTMGQIASLMRGESALWFFGNVVYDDIFGISHEHRFVWRYISGYFLPYYGNLEYTKNT